MGNRSNVKPPLRKTQATQILPSGESRGIEVGVNNLKSIKIKLILLDVRILAKASQFDLVTLVWTDSYYNCLFQNQLLGKVPANYNNLLNNSLVHTAVIAELKQQPPTVVIEIDL